MAEPKLTFCSPPSPQGYRVTRNVPLPYVTASASANSGREDDDEELPQSWRARTFAFLHQLHRGLVKDFAPLANIHLLVLGGSARSKRDARSKEKLAARKRRSRGTTGDSSTEEGEDDTAAEEDEEDELGDVVADDEPEVDGGRLREGAHERAEREREEAEEDEGDSDDDSDDEGVEVDAVKKALGDADRMMETSAEGVRTTTGMEGAEAALQSCSSINKLR